VKDLTQNTHKWLLDNPQTAKMSKAVFSLVQITSVTYRQWPHYMNGRLYEVVEISDVQTLRNVFH